MLLKIILLFTVIPAIEILLFVTVGRSIGLWATLGVVLVTGIVGAALAKKQGLRAWDRIGAALREGRLPGVELVDGLLIVIAGAVLLTPGFFTDAVGFLLLIPPTRAVARKELIRYFKRRVGTGQWQVYTSFSQPPPSTGPPDDDVIDVTAQVDPDPDELPPGR